MNDLPAPMLIWCPFPDVESAQKAARVLIEESLAACANIMPVMQSIYSWQDEIHEAQEVGVLFKSNVQAHSRCMTRLLALHPYSEPAILAWECPASLPQTIGWLAKLVG